MTTVTETSVRDQLEALGAEGARRRSEFDDGCRVPPDLYQHALRLGLFRQLVPEETGGLGCDPLDWFRTGRHLAHQEPSLGWVVTQGAAALGWLAAAGDPAWTCEVFLDPALATATSIAGSGTLEPDGADFVLEGTWSFVSGCEGASWLGGLAAVTGPEGPTTQLRWAVVPADRARIVRTWDTHGLRGTGSHTVTIDRQRIPARWTYDTFSPQSDPAGPHAVLIGNGNWPIATSVSATQLGIARRALDEIALLLPTKSPPPDLRPLSTSGAVQRTLMENEGLWSAANAGVESQLRRMWSAAQTSKALSTTVRVDLLTANVTANRLAVAIVDACYDLAGTSASPAQHPLARCLRDVHLLRGHISANPAALEAAGRAHLGLQHPHRLV